MLLLVVPIYLETFNLGRLQKFLKDVLMDVTFHQ